MSTGSFIPRTSVSTPLAEPVAIDLSLWEKAQAGLESAVAHLTGLQAAEGYWCAELEGDSILQSEYILMKWIVGQEDDTRLPKIAKYLRQQQWEDGSWRQYPGACKVDLSATVKGYFALKLCGDDPQAPHMQRAREVILRHGGAEKSNTYSRFYYAALGQLHYDNVPFVPPEIVYLPKFSYFHLDKISAWSRTMLMPLAIVTTYRPVRELPEHLGIRELYVNEEFITRPMMEFDRKAMTWKNLFITLDKAVKIFNSTGLTKLTPLRRKALDMIEQWIAEHAHNCGGLGAIFPPMIYTIIGFRARGHGWDHPVIAAQVRELDRLLIEDSVNDTIHFQPCFSPVWDTGYATYALADAGYDAAFEPARRAADWLISKECRTEGDWKANVREDVEPSGWFFEFENEQYPDVDDTAMVAMALRCIGTPEALAASKRGVRWMLAMQNDDGGWAAFDRTKNRPILETIPFADHNAIQDPSCPDITGRVLECFGHHGFTPDHPAVKDAVRFMKSRQERDGCWFGRWGVNYIYGTWQVVGGLRTIGYDMKQDWVQRAGQWLRSVQKADGSFGESADSYEDPSLRGTGPSTASQTAWGAMALMAVYGPQDPGVQRAIQWLLQTQTGSGTWEEEWFTGTGFPKVFYLRYHMYRLYFPIMAIGRWLKLSKKI